MPAPRTNYTPEQIAWRDEAVAALEKRGILSGLEHTPVVDPITRKIYVRDENGQLRETTLEEIK